MSDRTGMNIGEGIAPPPSGEIGVRNRLRAGWRRQQDQKDGKPLNEHSRRHCHSLHRASPPGLSSARTEACSLVGAGQNRGFAQGKPTLVRGSDPARGVATNPVDQTDRPIG